VLRNSIFSLATTSLRLMSSLVLFVLMAHVWGPRLFGTFMYPYAVAAILIKVVDYGFVLQLMRDIGKSPGQARIITGEALAAKALLVVPTVGAAAVIGLRLSHGTEYGALLALLLCDALANSFALFLNTPLRALGRFDLEAYIVAGANLALFLLIGLLVGAGLGPVAAAVGFLLARLGYLAASWQACVRILGAPPRPEWSRPALVSTLKRGFPFAVHATVGTLTAQMDTLLVEHYLGAAGVGVYQAGVRVLLGALLVADALNNVYLAALAPATRYPAEVKQLGVRMTRHLLALGALVLLGTFAASHWIVGLLFSDGYDQLIELLPLFGLLAFIRYGGVSYGTLLTLADKQMTRVAAILVTLVVSLIANMLLIPAFGLTGAIWATVMSHLLLYGVYMAAVWKDYHTLLGSWRSAGLLLIAAITVALLFAPWLDNPAIRFQLGVGLTILAGFLGVTRSEWSALSRKIRHPRLAQIG
jgi:O-antigen/teichoic acid export membrane protein